MMYYPYIIDIPYKNKHYCIEIGLYLNRIENITMLMLCLNVKRKKINFYFECDQNNISIINDIKEKMLNSFSIYTGNNFWEMIILTEWIAYTFVEGREKYNTLMMQILLDKI